jgi:hypothetical protein
MGRLLIVGIIRESRGYGRRMVQGRFFENADSFIK